MATGRWLSLLFSATFSALLIPCCGQQFQQIDLTAPNITCSMSSIYNGSEGRSLDCHGAINGNSSTTWITTGNEGANCLYTARRDISPSWQVDLGQPRNIHRIIIYTPADGRNYIQTAIVSIDGTSIYTFCNYPDCVKNPDTIADKLPVKGQVIKLTKGQQYLTMCELQVEGCALNMYGENCTRPCSSQCGENRVATTCDSITGYCFGCQTGWWGDKCDSQCSAKCDGPCERDNGDKCHRCINHFGPPQCIACLPGYYGDQCDKQCSEHCQPDNSGNKTCTQNNGHCTAGCESGWWGDKCDTECPAQCNGSCDAGDGHCSSCNAHFAPPLCTACVSGYYGDQCDQVCSEHCLPDNGKITCGQNNGNCTSGCSEGWYQHTCTERCGQNCDGGCERDTGACNGCLPGYYGTQCEAPCGNGCINKTCNRQNGECTCESMWSPPNCTECKNGYYGNTSCEPCGHCNTSNACDKNNGHCPGGCVDGYSGDLCDRCDASRLSTNCSLPCGQCAGDGSCDMSTGRCIGGCLEGFQGDSCTQKTRASDSSDTQDVGIIVGSIVGSILGAGLMIGLFILLATITRKRMSRDASSPIDPSGHRTEVQFSPENARPGVSLEENKPEVTDPESNYAHLENYENPDDIRPYSMLQTDRGHNTYINIQGDKEAVLYHNTSTTGDKTLYM